MLLLLDFKKIQFFFQKNPNFEHFERSYCFSRILGQIYYILVKKNFTFSNVNILPMLACRRERNWQTIGEEKTSEMAHLGGNSCFPYFQYGAKKQEAQSHSNFFRYSGVEMIG